MTIQVILYATSKDEQQISPELQKRIKDSKLETIGLLFLRQFIPKGEPYFEVKDDNGKVIYHSGGERFNLGDTLEEIRLVFGAIKLYREKRATEKN